MLRPGSSGGKYCCFVEAGVSSLEGSDCWEWIDLVSAMKQMALVNHGRGGLALFFFFDFFILVFHYCPYCYSRLIHSP